MPFDSLVWSGSVVGAPGADNLKIRPEFFPWGSDSFLCCECKNPSFLRELLNANLFESLEQVRDMAWVWMCDYNEERTHESLGNIPPAEYRRQLEASSFELSR